MIYFQSVHDNPHPSENYLRLELMASKVVLPLLGAKMLYTPDNVNLLSAERSECASLKSSTESSPNLDSPRGAAKKLARPISMVDQSSYDKDPDFDENLRYRHQRYRNSYGGRLLSTLTEGSQSLGSSFGSLIDD